MAQSPKKVVTKKTTISKKLASQALGEASGSGSGAGAAAAAAKTKAKPVKTGGKSSKGKKKAG